MYEIVVTIELVGPNGKTIMQRDANAKVTSEGYEAGFIGDIETELDAMVEEVGDVELEELRRDEASEDMIHETLGA